MQQNAISEVLGLLPEIDPCQIEMANGSTEESYGQELTQITEKIHSWAISVLEQANLPSTPHEANKLLEKFDGSSNEGCALRAVIELDAMHTSIRNTDAHTTALTGMKLFETIWQLAVTKINQTSSQITEHGEGSKENPGMYQDTIQESEENLKLYQDTINELRKKYPHCNVNALRLLASTRLNVTKLQLDELGISPQ